MVSSVLALLSVLADIVSIMFAVRHQLTAAIPTATAENPAHLVLPIAEVARWLRLPPQHPSAGA